MGCLVCEVEVWNPWPMHQRKGLCTTGQDSSSLSQILDWSCTACIQFHRKTLVMSSSGFGPTLDLQLFGYGTIYNRKLPVSSSTGKPWSCLPLALDQHWTYNCLVMEPCVTENCLCPVPQENPGHVFLWLWTNTGPTTVWLWNHV